ncbi:MAG TPA: PA14 domain-containing protein, partial [Parafilimonas sp.]|nr:PA14 domain-containing protein [Parafilimonas sp.]
VAPSITNYIDSNLSPKQKYFYAIRAIDSTGAAALSNEASATTSSDTTAPTIPDNFRTTYTTPSTISVAWDASTDNVGVDHYNIYINGSLSNVTTQTSFILTGLTQSTPYALYVKAVDGSNNVSGASSQITAEPILGGLQYSYYTTNNAWSVLPNFSTLTPVKTGVSQNTDITVATQSTNYGFLWQGYISVPVNGTYTFGTTSDDGSALWFNSYTPTGTPTVNNDKAHSSQTRTSSAITLTAGIYPICIEFFQGGGGANMSVSWASTALFGNTTQHNIDNKYFVGTYVNAGSVPAVPTTVTATALAYNKIKVNWTDKSNNETSFEVYRSTSVNGDYNIAGTVGLNSTTYTDSALAPSTTYYYKVQAVNKYGNSGLSTQDTTVSSTNGLNYSFYTGTWSVLPDFTTLTPAKTGFSSTTDISVATQSTNYGFVWHGYLKTTKSGTYTFQTTSDDGSALWVNSNTASGTRTVNNDGLHGSTTVTSSSVSLSAGTYPITVEFFQQGGGANMSISYKVPGTSNYVTIPSSALFRANIGAVPSATTFALPAPPSAPANFKAIAASASQISLTWNSVSGATGYQLFRSIGDNSNYISLTTVAANTTSYSDTGLNSNLIHYYKIQATGVGGTVSTASLASATTKDNLPVISQLSSRAVPYSSGTTINITAADADGDILSYTSANLPAFASLVSNGSNGASLILNPSQTDQGVYNNIKILVADPYGGKDSTVFTLTVNNNYAPTIDAIANYSLNENEAVSIPLTAHDQNGGDILSWSVSNVPNAYTLTDNGNGSATLVLNPDFSSAGNYNPVVTVNDGNGGITSATFNVVVKDVNPNTKIYVRFKYNTPIGSPWNSITSTTTNNLVDDQGKTTNVGLAFQTSWFGNYNSGVSTGNNSGVYPDAVLADYYYFGYFGGPETVDTKITGLDASSTYNLTFFGASNYNNVPDNGSTVYTVGNQSDTLRVQNNTTNTVTLTGIKPASDGTITYTMSKGLNTPIGYINALVISSVYNGGAAPAAPTNLTAQNADGKGVQLSWTDVAFNETGYNVYRALTSNSIYTQIGQTLVDATSFTDTTASGNTQFSYKVAAFNSQGISDYSNVATITTTNQIPKINAIADVSIKYNQTATVNISATDDATDHITLSVSGLPSFATFVDNGNGTGKITVTPTANSLGGYPVTITATDNSNATASIAFNILISDPNISSTYLSFSDGAHNVPKPWNLIAPYPFKGSSYGNITDDSNAPTGITVTLKNGFQGVVQSGMQPVEGVGIYPNVVMRTADYEGTNAKDTIQITGLSTSKKYNFIFFNSHDDGINGTTNFTIGAQTVTLNATDNLTKTVELNAISPDATGRVYVVVSKATGADYAFISTMVIQSYASTYATVAPANLSTTTITRNSIGLQWQDRASTETGYEIWRAADGASSYSLLTTVSAGTTTYTDNNLTTNTTYNYAVRAVFSGPVYSSFSNTVSASTYAYNVYLNYTLSNNAPLPWNNLDAIPQIGYTWNNFFDEKGMITSTGMQLSTNWAGLYSDGKNPLNNLGAVPDTVAIDSYGLFPGQTASFQITGLNIGMKYDFTFFASSNALGDVNVAYVINGVTTILNASLNVNGTQTIYGVTPDSYGNVTISVAPGTPQSQFGLIGALIIKGYTPSTSSVMPTLPAGGAGLLQTIVSSVTDSFNATASKINDGEIKAFPNPFRNYFNLNVPSQNNSKVQVMVYDATGKIVYSNTFGSMHQGVNSLKIVANGNLTAGVYTVVAINIDTKTIKTIKLLKQ